MRVTPSLPKRGRQPKGSKLLTPCHASFFRKFLINRLMRHGILEEKFNISGIIAVDLDITPLYNLPRRASERP